MKKAGCKNCRTSRACAGRSWPAGLLIASRSPRLDDILAPPPPDRTAIIAARGISERYQKQVAQAEHALQQIEGYAVLAPLWQVIQTVTKALSQEYFHRTR